MRFQNWTLGSGNEESYCYYYRHHGDLCEASYLQTPGYRNGLTVPCVWTGDDCVAQDSGGLVCSDFDCGTGLLASKSSVHHGAMLATVHAPGLRGSSDIAPQSMEPLPVSGPSLLEMGRVHQRIEDLEEEEVEIRSQKRAAEL